MSEKELQTRIALKYDTLEQWNKSTLVLKKGEIAFCSIPADGKPVDGSTNQSVLYKVGDGEHTFSELNWGMALAADVYAWAKASTKPGYGADEITFSSEKIADVTTVKAAIEKAYEHGDDYSIVKAEDSGDYNAIYRLMKGTGEEAVQAGVDINIPKDFLVKSASVKICTEKDKPVEGLEVGDKYIDFVINVASGSVEDQHIYLPVKDLVISIYTGIENEETTTTVDGKDYTIEVTLNAVPVSKIKKDVDILFFNCGDAEVTE